MEWLSDNPVIPLAALIVAITVVWSKGIVPLYKAFRAFFRRAKSLTAEVEVIRALVAQQHDIVSAELTPNSGKSMKDLVTKLQKGQADLAAMVTTHMALTEAQLEHYVKQLRALGLELEDLPDARTIQRRLEEH